MTINFNKLFKNFEKQFETDGEPYSAEEIEFFKNEQSEWLANLALLEESNGGKYDT